VDLRPSVPSRTRRDFPSGPDPLTVSLPNHLAGGWLRRGRLIESLFFDALLRRLSLNRSIRLEVRKSSGLPVRLVSCRSGLPRLPLARRLATPVSTGAATPLLPLLPCPLRCRPTTRRTLETAPLKNDLPKDPRRGRGQRQATLAQGRNPSPRHRWPTEWRARQKG